MAKRVATYVSGLALVCCGLAVVVRGQRNDRAPEKWAAEASMHSPRSGACSVLLQDGRVLIAGGAKESGALSSAEVFDASGSFSQVASMSIGRSRQACSALADGTVLAAGGDTTDGAAASAEIYSPATRSWTLVRPMAAARAGATASLLTDGRVL